MNANTIVSLICVLTILAVLGGAVVALTWSRGEIGAGWIGSEGVSA